MAWGAHAKRHWQTGLTKRRGPQRANAAALMTGENVIHERSPCWKSQRPSILTRDPKALWKKM